MKVEIFSILILIVRNTNMDENLIFRIIVIALIVTSLTVSIYFRRKAQQSSADQIDRRHEGDFIMIALRIGGGLTWLTIFAYLVYPPAIAWATLPLPGWLRWLGVFGGFAAVILLIWMFRSLGMNISVILGARGFFSPVPVHNLTISQNTSGGVII
jgi:protein-S-isoprenylcysteine O-methyltransferase Ste14